MDISFCLEDFIQTVSWSPDGSLLVAGLTGGPVILLEATALQIRHHWSGHDGGTFGAGFSPRDPVVASVGQDGAVYFWHPEKDQAVATFETGSSWVEQMSWAPDGSFLAIGAGKKSFLLRPDGSVAHTLAPAKSTVTALTWSADSKQIAAACYGEVRRWKASTAEPESPLPWQTSLISLSWSPDQRWVVAGTQEQSIQIWELPFRPGEELAMSGYPGKVRELVWHYSGRYLATGGGEEVMVWDCGNKGPAGTTPRILEGHRGRIHALAYQGKGHLLASGGEDGLVLLWNAGKSTTPLRRFRLPSTITSLAWSRDDQRLAIGCQDGTVAILHSSLV